MYLGGLHNDLGPDRAVRGADPAALDGGDGGLLVDLDAARGHGVGQAADQPGRVQRRTVRGQGPADSFVHGDHVGDLRRVEQAHVVFAEAPRAPTVHLGACPGQLRAVTGHRQVAATGQ